jgi:hypothetical protein
MPRERKAAECECGQVMFDVVERKAGDTLSCPWCERRYRYLGDNQIEPLTGKESDAPAKKEHAPDAEPPKNKKKKHKQPDKAPDDSSKRDEKKDESDKDDLKRLTEDLPDKEPVEVVEGSEEVLLVQHDEPPLPKRPSARRRDTIRERGPGESRRSDAAAFKEIPGGVVRMLIFIVAFNALAFLALAFVFPRQGDARLTPWGALIPKSKIPWPELATLILGHLAGFVAWSWSIYRLYATGKLQRPPAPQPKDDPHLKLVSAEDKDSAEKER